jgi:hypothetical protein
MMEMVVRTRLTALVLSASLLPPFGEQHHTTVATTGDCHRKQQ